MFDMLLPDLPWGLDFVARAAIELGWPDEVVDEAVAVGQAEEDDATALEAMAAHVEAAGVAGGSETAEVLRAAGAFLRDGLEGVASVLGVPADVAEQYLETVQTGIETAGRTADTYINEAGETIRTVAPEVAKTARSWFQMNTTLLLLGLPLAGFVAWKVLK